MYTGRAELTPFNSLKAVWSRELLNQFSDPGPGWALFIMYVVPMHVWTFSEGAWVYLHILVCAVVHVHCACVHGMGALCRYLQYMHAQKDPEAMV